MERLVCIVILAGREGAILDEYNIKAKRKTGTAAERLGQRDKIRKDIGFRGREPEVRS